MHSLGVLSNEFANTEQKKKEDKTTYKTCCCNECKEEMFLAFDMQNQEPHDLIT